MCRELPKAPQAVIVPLNDREKYLIRKFLKHVSIPMVRDVVLDTPFNDMTEPSLNAEQLKDIMSVYEGVPELKDYVIEIVTGALETL